MSSLQTINASDQPKDSRSVINSNFSALNTDKVENGTSVGTGEGTVFKDKSSTNLRFKKIKAGSNVSVTDDGNDITVAASAPTADASTSTKGITKLSVAPASASNPIAAGTNDPRIPTQDENDALGGTSGTPSTANKFVTNDDPRLAASTPTGVITMYGGATAPTGYLLCDGSSVSRSTYSALFAILGTAYGAGDGSTTFNVPDFRGRGPMGKNSGTFATLGNTGGEESHTLTTGEMPSHSHNFTASDTDGGTVQYVHRGNVNSATFATNNAGGGAAHNVLDPYLVVNFIIKV